MIASRWFTDLGAYGLDGIMAKQIHEPYHAGDRQAMMKVKHMKTADCVVGGFRYSATTAKTDKADHTSKKTIGSLLLGLHDNDGVLHFVGFTSSFVRKNVWRLKNVVEPLKGGAGFSGKSPGGPNRWSKDKAMNGRGSIPVLVCEIPVRLFFTRSLPTRHKILTLAAGKRAIVNVCLTKLKKRERQETLSPRYQKMMMVRSFFHTCFLRYRVVPLGLAPQFRRRLDCAPPS